MPAGLGTVVWMLLVTVLILLLAWAAARWIATRGPSALPGLTGGDERFRLVGQLPLGRSERLALVRLQERCLLLGVTEHGITLLRVLEGPEAEEWLRGPENGPQSGFLDALGEALRKRNERK